MGTDEESNKKTSSSEINKEINWRKKMIVDVLGDEYLDHGPIEKSDDQDSDDFLRHRLLGGDDDQEKIEKEPDIDIIEFDDLEKKLEAYYTDQKESDRKVFEYHTEDCRSEEIWEWIKYRWEFMRRSPDYIAAFEQEQNISETETDSFNLFKRFEFWKSFGLLCSGLPNPNLSFEELQEIKKHDISEEPFFRLNYITKNYRTDAGISYFTYLDEEINFSEFNKIQFIIDFTKLKSINDLKKIVGRLIDDHWKDYHKRVGHKKKADNLDVYKRILRVGDLKEKEGLTHKKIAEMIFKSAENLKSGQRKVSIYYKRYKDLINGGYKNI